MPRPAIDPFWRDQIRSISANNPGLGPAPVLQRLDAMAAQAGRPDCPSLRTVGREQKRFRETSEAERREYREFRWPASMERGDLPWEASAVGMELLRYLHGPGPNDDGWRGEMGRPLVSTVRWLWRVTLARPDAPLNVRLWWARDLAVSAAGIADCRLDVEAAMVAGVARGSMFFGEVVHSPYEDGLTLRGEAIEIAHGWPIRNEPGPIDLDELTKDVARYPKGQKHGKARKR